MPVGDTIAAIATPSGRGGLGVVRLSGSRSLAVATTILSLPHGDWQPWRARLAVLTDAAGRTVDHVLATWFAAPRSYTAEDVVEISCHGAPVVLRLCLERALAAGARLAEPGEFTLRAYLNGRIDLPQAEAVRDLIEATTLYQARVAARQSEGSLSRMLAPVKEQLLELVALLEAGIDFAEDDVSVASAEELLRRLDPLLESVRQLHGTFDYGRMVHDGVTLAIAGRPNVGKSSLFNRLLEQDRAIVTELPGTTRDLISEVAEIHGVPVRLVDTAGIREGEGLVEKLGIERSFRAMADADVTLVVVDISSPLGPDDLQLIEKASRQGRWILAGNKCDLPRVADLPAEGLAVSARTGEGVASLRAAIIPEAPDERQAGFITSLRHERLLGETMEALERAQIAVGENIPHEMLLLDLYSALRPLDAITGATTADDILNRIFSTFCIGK